MSAPTSYSLTCAFSLTDRSTGNTLLQDSATITNPTCPAQPLLSCWGTLGNSVGQLAQLLSGAASPYQASFTSQCTANCPSGTTYNAASQLCMPNGQ
jgi:hypothetical protein